MDKIDKIMAEFIQELGYEKAMEMFKCVSSGKKLRSKLLLKIANEDENVLKLCAIIELIHLASLLHDDVIDDADTRRGKPSINSLFGVKNSIMLGDIFYSKGFYELSKFSPNIAKEVSFAVSRLSIGELMDVELGGKFNFEKQKYMDMIYYKTAVLIEATAACGAMMAGLNVDKFRIYGKNLGLAFQIIDDVLDITQDSATLGKPAMNDYKEGKTTLPYIYLYENLNSQDKEYLKSLHGKDLNEKENSWIKDKFYEFGCIKRAIDEARTLCQEALEAISEYKNFELEGIIKSMIDREF
ncbi:polyprenyl synthetase family protein [Campylobacter sp. RM9344]|uniref:Polyprenyl synthetase family protein n=1 Tax=Campylobacter californiensis TaxID=1032243 RepID=A0AAW3ZUV0_9BACT|nr:MULTISPECIES: polyprenyl synthetase family protein [unclassified Campylobacter]MBE2983778.1 polyprenyl synthetase family protein [Campylobacter sp. RM6883]MBE2985658.1 polyprenyl synthetase family protein [Campylobacter sp. RM12919]MBE2987313.1 polyprenyl synthetase family protein [Campylobacter sp. RM12920]MBE2994316.1 polyprenyl synthetase family protein [Campylobacter sp. RM6913]MBE3028624.1 polyprenyl synthetase family protein [Campylobacter sp. RM9344]